MRRIYTLVILAFCSVSLLQAQVTLTRATHGFTPGASHSSQAVIYQEPGEAGSNVVWDFSQAILLEKTSVSNSDILENYDESNVVVHRDDNISFFYNITDKGNEYKGYRSGNATVLFTEPLLKTKYPQTFGTYFEGNFSGLVTYEDFDKTNEVSGFYSTHADGYGTITLPDGKKYSALRVHTVERSDNKKNGGYYETQKYLWYAQNVRLPLFVSLEIYAVNAKGEKRLADQRSYLNTSIEEEYNKAPQLRLSIPGISVENSYSVFPNPFKDDVTVNYSLTEETVVSIELFDSKGARLATVLSEQVQNGNQSVRVDVSKYTQAQDVYLLRLKFGDKVYTEKLIKSVN